MREIERNLLIAETIDDVYARALVPEQPGSRDASVASSW